MDLLQSIYERTHNYYVALFTAWLVLVGAVLGGFIALLQNEQVAGPFTTAIVIAAVTSVGIAIVLLKLQIRRLHRDYLDILQVYNLLAQYF